MKETEQRYEESVGVVLAYGPSLSSLVSKTKTNNNERFLLVKSPRGVVVISLKGVEDVLLKWSCDSYLHPCLV